ncbi:MAG: hypothetical protein LBU32_08375 [Clostridiales bacterium]|nr:hypothetical protein [Clostridiales bacterium]
MIETERLKVGMASIIQLNFRGDKEAQFALSREELKEASKALNFELSVYPEMIATAEQAASAAKFFIGSRVDFLLVQNTSLASGLLMAELASAAPAIGLWAVKEQRESGFLPQNSLCGLNLNASIMKGYLGKTNFKWFFGDFANPLMGRRFALTVAALSAKKALMGAEILHIGGTAPGFIGFYNDERALKKRLGLSVREVEYGDLKKLALSYPEGKVEKLAEEMESKTPPISALAKEKTIMSARVKLAIEELSGTASAIAMSCWPRFRQDFSFTPCAVFGALNESGRIIACEGDILSAASMLALKAAAGFEPILMDMVSFDEKDDSVQLWHCGVGSRTYAANGVTLDTHYNPGPFSDEKGWLLAGPAALMEFAPQKLTCMRFAPDANAILTFSGEIIGNKPLYHGSAGWLGNLEADKAPLTSTDLIHTIMTEGFPHHYPLVKGHVESAVREMARWLDVRAIEIRPYKEYE